MLKTLPPIFPIIINYVIVLESRKKDRFPYLQGLHHSCCLSRPYLARHFFGFVISAENNERTMYITFLSQWLGMLHMLILLVQSSLNTVCRGLLCQYKKKRCLVCSHTCKVEEKDNYCIHLEPLLFTYFMQVRRKKSTFHRLLDHSTKNHSLQGKEWNTAHRCP